VATETALMLVVKLVSTFGTLTVLVADRLRKHRDRRQAEPPDSS